MQQQGFPSQRSSVIAGALWMIGVTLLLFFLPAFNGVIGGFVGGYKVGSVGRALLAAVLPALVISMAFWGLMASFHLPLIGLFAGTTIGVIIAWINAGIFIGALIGGALSSK